MMSLNQAAQWGVERIRRPEWSESLDHFKVDIVDGKPGPWLHLYAPVNVEMNGADPYDMVWAIEPFALDPNAEIFVAYHGPLPGSREYQARCKAYKGWQA